MRTIPLTSIVIPPDRQRRDFDPAKLAKLAESIRAPQGLLNPIVLRPDGLTLVAGERRVRAVATFVYGLGQHFTHEGEPVPFGHIPYTTTAELTYDELEEAELAENVHRENLTWQEEAQARARLYELRQRQAQAAGVAPPTMEAVGSEVMGDSRPDTAGQAMGTALALARGLASPEVARAKTASEAIKIIRNQERQATFAALGLLAGDTVTAESHKVVHGDCIEWMTRQEPGQFDVILTDPPYGMGADKFGDAAGKLTGTEHHYDDSLPAWRALMEEWAVWSYLIAADQAHAYVFCDFDNFHYLKEYMQEAGWDVFRTPLLSIKTGGSGRVPRPEHGPRRTYECILYAIKGNRRVISIQPDTIPCAGDDQIGHGAQKPVELFVNLLRRSVRPGDAVLDTFAGTGTILPAAHAVQCVATAIEQEAAAYGMCLQRLKELK